MFCPKCQSKLKTLDTRTTYNAVLRIRSCYNCDTRYKTVERIDDDEKDITTLPRGRYIQTD